MVDYEIEYVSTPDVSTFEWDFPVDRSPDGLPAPGFHLFADGDGTANGCPSCHHGTADLVPLQQVVTQYDVTGIAGHAETKVADWIHSLAPITKVYAATWSGPLARVTTLSDVSPEQVTLSAEQWTNLKAQLDEYKAQRITSRNLPPEFNSNALIAFMSCKCSVVHAEVKNASDSKKKPPGAIGCGRYWLIAITFSGNSKNPQPTLWNVPRTEDFKLLAAANSLSSAAAASASTVQSIAGKWQTALTTILGAVATVSVIGGRDTFAKLAWWPSKTALIVAAVLALISNVAAIYQFNLASTGRTKIVPTGTMADLKQSDLDPLRQARAISKSFSKALSITITSFALSLIALILVWLLPDKATPPDQTDVNLTITVTPSPSGTVSPTPTTTTVCGALVTSPMPAPGQVVVSRASQKPRVALTTVAPSSVLNVDPGPC